MDGLTVASPDDYSQHLLIEDLRALLAHPVGLSLGGNVVLNLALRYVSLCRSIVGAGTGSGTVKSRAVRIPGRTR